MTLYLAYNDTDTLMHGYFEQCLGIFDSEEKAWDHLKTTTFFESSEPTKDGQRVFHYDGEMSIHWYVKAVELNRPI